MRRVYLLRHAKWSWKDRSLADRDRPLAGRGRRAAIDLPADRWSAIERGSAELVGYVRPRDLE
jgi:phosphohistidine phosphatase SixA